MWYTGSKRKTDRKARSVTRAINRILTRLAFADKEPSLTAAVDQLDNDQEFWSRSCPEQHPKTCTCWECKGDPFAGIPGVDYFGKVTGFGACETDVYPELGAEQWEL